MNLAEEIPLNKAWKYAQTEWERRFLLQGPPPGLKKLLSKSIEDRYLKHTHIRLRKSSQKEQTHFKLSKKLMLENKSQHWISTIYLSETEYELFAQLPALMLKKRRYYYHPADQEVIGIDHIALGEKEIWLAEVEFSSLSKMEAYTFPLAFIREVSEEHEYSGVEIARVFSSLTS